MTAFARDRLGLEDLHQLLGVDARAPRSARAPSRSRGACVWPSSSPAQPNTPPRVMRLSGSRAATSAREDVLDPAGHHDVDVVGVVAGGVDALAGLVARAPRDRRDLAQQLVRRVAERRGSRRTLRRRPGGVAPRWSMSARHRLRSPARSRAGPAPAKAIGKPRRAAPARRTALGRRHFGACASGSAFTSPIGALTLRSFRTCSVQLGVDRLRAQLLDVDALDRVQERRGAR